MFRKIFCFIILFVVVLTVSAEKLSTTKAPVHGHPLKEGKKVSINEVPYHASMLYYGWIFLCSGAIIADNVIITAAHCANGNPSQWLVHVGSIEKSEKGTKHAVSQMIFHDGYVGGKNEFNICLFILATPIRLDGINTAAIPIAPPGHEIPSGELAVNSAWGGTDNTGVVEYLQQIELPIVDQKTCRKNFASIDVEITDTMICAGSFTGDDEASCEGDGGSPIAIDCFLVGISSWSLGCVQGGYPGIWTRMSAVSEWIQDTIASLESPSS